MTLPAASDDAVLRKGGKWDGEVTELEKSTTDSDGGGCKGLETMEVFASQDVDGFFGMAGMDAGTGAGVSVCAGVDAVDKLPSMSGSPNAAIMSCCVSKG